MGKKTVIVVEGMVLNSFEVDTPSWFLSQVISEALGYFWTNVKTNRNVYLFLKNGEAVDPF